MDIPPLTFATVASVDEDNYGLNVILHGVFGGQMPSLPVKVGTHGPRDGVRGDYPELPAPGGLGIVAFPRGDHRNGVWLCSIDPNLLDASPNAPGVRGVSHRAHYSGAWRQHDAEGNTVLQLPDGTTLLAGVMPAPTRHTLDGNQVRQATPYPLSERVPSPPGALPLSLAHPSGASLSLSAAGAAAVVVPSGQPFTVTFGGGSIADDGAGNLNLTSTNITLTGNVAIDGGLTVTGGVTAGFGGGDQVGLQTHKHPANGSPPTPGT